MKKLELAKWATQYALKQGATECEVSVSNARNVEVEVRDKTLEKLKETTENSLSIYIYLDNKFSGHFTNDLRKETLEKFIEQAVASTKYLAPDKYRKLLDPSYYPKDISLDLQLEDKSYNGLTTDRRIEIAKELEELAMSKSDKLISATAGFSDTIYSSAKVFSNGFEGKKHGTMYSVGVEVTAKDNDARPEDYAYTASRFFEQLPSMNELANEATTRALQKIGQKKIESGNFDMLVENRAASGLIGMLIGAMSAQALQQKNSFLENMLGKQVASEKLTITDNPFIKGGMSSRLYDGDGIAAKQMVMIENGILKNYYIDHYYGQKLEMELTSGGSSNLEFALGTKDLNQLITSIQKGILVTGFNGGNSNPTTGDFSFGISGLLIENGILTQPIYEMNIAGNAIEFWSKLVELGSDAYQGSAWYRPSLLFENIYFSGI